MASANDHLSIVLKYGSFCATVYARTSSSDNQKAHALTMLVASSRCVVADSDRNVN